MKSKLQILSVSISLSLCAAVVIGQASTFASAAPDMTTSPSAAPEATTFASATPDTTTFAGGSIRLATTRSGASAVAKGHGSRLIECVDQSARALLAQGDRVLLAQGDGTGAQGDSSAHKPRDPNGKLPEVLDPKKFFGQAEAGYAACKEIPEICDKLFCYCGCDLTDCHGSLLDCFTNDHGEDCHICQEEAIIALKMHKKGKTLSDIQREIDKRFQKEYPFEVESPTLQKYKANRLWDAGKKKAPTGKLGTVQPQDAPPGAADGGSPPKRKLKPDGSCCAGND